MSQSCLYFAMMKKRSVGLFHVQIWFVSFSMRKKSLLELVLNLVLTLESVR